uniref:Uncharacterized protein n=1 Tax=Glossina morsitans morsitans TaxID=37546 RepID=A0A1B0FEE5_GLOMM
MLITACMAGLREAYRCLKCRSSLMTIFCSAMVVTPCKFANFGSSWRRKRSMHRFLASVFFRGRSAVSWSSTSARGFPWNASGLPRASFGIVSTPGSPVGVWPGVPLGRHVAVLFAHFSLAPNILRKLHPSSNGSCPRHDDKVKVRGAVSESEQTCFSDETGSRTGVHRGRDSSVCDDDGRANSVFFEV